MSGRLSYIEIGASDPHVASSFLSTLFDWKFTPMGDAGEGWFATPTLKAGLHREPEACRVDVYFNVPDLNAAIARVKPLGGHADEPGAEEPGFGRFCHCRTPDGLRFGLHQP
jgi:predicted enzyme related to lactoylglutathione lyase